MSFISSQAYTGGAAGEMGSSLASALSEFRQARREAGIKAVLNRLHGTSLALLSYSEVAEMLDVTGQVERGVREIPLDRIVGSVGRANEFDRSFLPLNDQDAQRWASVRAAAHDPSELPAIDVYQIGDAYFVIDGNHRVSIARHNGMRYLEANVVEIKTRVPLPAEHDPEALIVASEEAHFLARTHLDRLRPEADVRTAICGQFRKLEDHIEVHRYFVEREEARQLDDEEAVLHWYDEAYLPVVEVIREQGLLRGFKDRTELDLYLWVADNQAALSKELGWDLATNTAVENLLPDAPGEGIARRLYRSVLRAVAPRQVEAEETWSHHRLLERYSERLFPAILLLTGPKRSASALAQAAQIATLEEGQVLGIAMEPATASKTDLEHRQSTQQWFHSALDSAGVGGEIGFVRAEAAEIIRRRSHLVDLLVLDTDLFTAVEEQEKVLESLLSICPRPVLFVPGAERPIARILLCYDGRREAEEALFVTAYLAEQWGSAVYMMAEAQAAPRALNHAAPYLEMHERPPEAVIAGDFTPLSVFTTAVKQDCDLVIIGGYAKNPLRKAAVAAWLCGAPDTLRRPLLICP